MSADDLARFIADRLDEHERGAREVQDARAVQTTDGHRTMRGPWIASGSLLLAEQPDGVYHDVAEVIDYKLDPLLEHIARHDPTHVLAFVAAGRAILEQHRPVVQAGYRDMTVGDAVCASCGDQGVDITTVYAPCPTLRAFAAIWAGHPAWREEWRA